ncbi:hypothetical protein PWEIH_06711 [Listeria weihenstephanensis FSL R9-0317]|uniref:DUF1871 domain-containing protein n=1 Tax=Listeria weihenstephanensis TaxID=1006155 RepID=A0A1S7FQI1_9LIST|nr:DUF1871 family protein [Listeria weihenstephanensis]AQY49663.1 hypothetical protein UE46_00335 [Listeria weihenstephanensis]EUJ39590.1 hypothetical protein PWEIH_06711 [Listeria weihenstephanensis FSL R9-0317]
MRNKVKDVIDEWDPIEVLPFAPSDEYDSEINQIVYFLNRREITDFELADKIEKVFIDAFDDSIIQFTKKEYLAISRKILSENTE